MTSAIFFMVLIGIVTAIPTWYIVSQNRRHRREQLLRMTPFPTDWSEIIQENFPLYKRIPEQLKNKLHGDILIFIDEKRFEGCDGFTITNEVKLTIAAQACTLLLNRTNYVFPSLTTILVYPSTYMHRQSVFSEAQQTSNDMPVAGISYGYGVVSLAWNHVIGGARNSHDGDNVVFHEFAHQLDSDGSLMSDLPRLTSVTARQWIATVDREFQQFIAKIAAQKADVIDEYGATNPAEFFAVVTETFFEKPVQLFREHHNLFEMFREFYRVDPREWF